MLSMAFQYDADGQRVKKTVNGTATTYWRDTDGKIMKMQKGSDVLLFMYEGDGRRVGFLLNGTGYYYVYNAQGDVVGLIDKTGTSVVQYSYDSWGRPVSVTGTLAATVGQLNPFRYRGYEYDAETGLYYLLSRYYDPMTMRFVNADGIIGANADMATHNMFVYCGNNPINRADNGGYSWLDDLCNAIIDGADKIFPGIKKRGQKAFTSPYDCGNWLTMGAFDSVKGTFFPEKPLSLQHWVDSTSTAFMLMPAINSGSNLLSSLKAPKPKLGLTNTRIPKNPGVPFKPGITGLQTGVNPNTLSPTKNLNTLDPLRMKNAVKFGGDMEILVGRTGKILDGHHRTAAAIMNGQAIDVFVEPYR